MRFLSQSEAQQLDVQLMDADGEYAFTLEQLMELAGLAVAQATYQSHPGISSALVVCGPGNNGGDGMVAARHLKHFGLEVTVCYPKRGKNKLYASLVKQCTSLGIPIIDTLDFKKPYDIVVDAIFGFGFSGEVREPFADILNRLRNSKIPIVSIDIPSGWDVEKGNLDDRIEPETLISLSAPKLCAFKFKGNHFLGGRFIPGKLAEEYKLDLPEFLGTDQCVRL